VQLVVFSDFQCGFCRQLAPTLRSLPDEFPGQVAVVFRQFPLSGHPDAFRAAIAAECAGEQGAFWPFHDQLFAENEHLDEARFLALASMLGLDQPRFAACLRSERPRQQVEASLREGMQLGLEGTPILFLNGRRVEGPLSHDNLVQRIREALRSSLSESLSPR
jgi:protein-disulfide isomerase